MLIQWANSYTSKVSRTVVKKPQILICTAYWIDGAGCAAAVGSGSGFEADWQAFLFGAQYLHSELFFSIPSFKSPAKKEKKYLCEQRLIKSCTWFFLAFLIFHNFSAAKALVKVS